jgi:DNA-binding GntR family transcriptional regulator
MTQPVQTRRVKEALARIRILFIDPGAKLSTADAAEMAGLDRQVCQALMQNLVEAGFLEQRLRGVFVRSSSASPQPSRWRIVMAKKNQ